MSCFWDSLFSSITDNDYKYLYLSVYDIKNNLDKIDKDSLINILNDIKKTNLSDMILLLIKYNRKCTNVKWNDEKINDKIIAESFDHVNEFLKNNGNKEINIDNDINIQNIINDGYLCSICDPFLILICELFELGIDHRYLGNVMKYRNMDGGNRRIVGFTSDHGHFKVG